MKVFENQEFRRFYDQDTGAVYENLEFRRCRFVNCVISITLEPRLRTTVRNVRLINCEVVNCGLRCAVVEEVLVDGLKTTSGTGGLFQAWGAVFKHVTLRGKIGRVMFSPVVFPGKATPEQQRAFDEANEAYYKTVDWALDIREAEFEEFDNRAIPGRLIRRDPETQILITREKALRGEWRQLDLSRTYWRTYIEEFLKDGDPDLVLVAPKRSKRFKELLAGLKLLRDAGVAEPD